MRSKKALLLGQMGGRDVWAQADVAANVQTRTDDAAIDLLAGKSFAEAEAALGRRTKPSKL